MLLLLQHLIDSKLLSFNLVIEQKLSLLIWKGRLLRVSFFWNWSSLQYWYKKIMNKWIVTKKLFIYWNLYLHLHLDCEKTSTTKEAEYYYIILNKEKTIKMNWEIIKTAQQEKFHNIFYPCLLFTCYSHHNLTSKQKKNLNQF